MTEEELREKISYKTIMASEGNFIVNEEEVITLSDLNKILSEYFNEEEATAKVV